MRHGCPTLICTLLVAVAGCTAAPKQHDGRSSPPVAAAERAAVESEQVADAQVVSWAEPAATSAVQVESLAAPPAAAGHWQGEVAVQELVDYALSNNPEIAAAAARAESLMARIPQVSSLEDPMLMTTIFLEEIQTAAGPQEVMMSVSQRLPWFGKLALRGDMAYHQAQAAYAELADVQLKVAEEVKLPYYDLYFLDRAIEVNVELQARLEDVRAVSRTLYETNRQQVGLESVLQADVTLSQLQISLVELRQARVRAVARLAEALNVPPSAVADLRPLVADSLLPQQVETLVATLEQCHPQLGAQREQFLRADAAIALARKEYYPDLNLGLNWYAIGEQGLSRVATGEDAYAMVLGVNIPLYQAKRDAAVREAAWQRAQSTRQYEATLAGLAQQVQTYYSQAVEQDEVLEILNEEVLEKAEQTLELSFEAYRNGRIGFQQLIDNYETLLEFRVQHHLRRAQREQALARLERVFGCTLASTGVGLVPDAAPTP